MKRKGLVSQNEFL